MIGMIGLVVWYLIVAMISLINVLLVQHRLCDYDQTLVHHPPHPRRQRHRHHRRLQHRLNAPICKIIPCYDNSSDKWQSDGDNNKNEKQKSKICE